MVIKLCQHTEFCNEELQSPFAASLLIKQLPMVMTVIGWVWKWPFHAILSSKKKSELKRIYLPTHSDNVIKMQHIRLSFRTLYRLCPYMYHVSIYDHRRYTLHYALYVQIGQYIWILPILLKVYRFYNSLIIQNLRACLTVSWPKLLSWFYGFYYWYSTS